jgi:HSP20 family protein
MFNESRGNVPSVNIIENENDFVIEFAAPGVKKQEFNINLENQVLTISREVKEEKEEKKDNYTRREFVFGSFSRSFTLPKNVKFEDVKADYNEGILQITIPKKEEEAKLSREIKIA